MAFLISARENGGLSARPFPVCAQHSTSQCYSVSRAVTLKPRDMPYTMTQNCRSPIDLRQLYSRGKWNLMSDTAKIVPVISDEMAQQMATPVGTCKKDRVDTVKVGYGPHL